MATMADVTLLRQLITEYIHLVQSYVGEVVGFKHKGYPKKCYEEARSKAGAGKIDAALSAIKEAKRKLPGGVIGFLRSEVGRLEHELDRFEQVGNPPDLIEIGDNLLDKLRNLLEQKWVDIPAAIKAHKNALAHIPEIGRIALKRVQDAEEKELAKQRADNARGVAAKRKREESEVNTVQPMVQSAIEELLAETEIEI